LAAGTVALTADRTVNSLRIEQAAQLDLGGHTLTVDSGGLLMTAMSPPAPNVANGRLVPGPSAGGEMFFYGGSIAAEIADGPAGPTSVTTNGVVHLSGANTYTGATRVTNFGILWLDGAEALPAVTDLTLEDGGVYASYTSATPVKVGALRMGGNASASYFSGGTPVDAASYDLIDGRIEAALVGSGPLTKRSDGYLRLTGDNAHFTGAIDLQGGTVEVSTLGNWPVRLRAGRLLVQSGLDNAVTVDGGSLTSATGQAVPIRGAVHITADAILGRLDVSGPMTVDAGAVVSVWASGPLKVTGDLRLDGRFVPDAAPTPPAGTRSDSPSPPPPPRPPAPRAWSARVVRQVERMHLDAARPTAHQGRREPEHGDRVAVRCDVPQQRQRLPEAVAKRDATLAPGATATTHVGKLVAPPIHAAMPLFGLSKIASITKRSELLV
jgi:autotransporter-associated beta strand protein